MLLLNTCYKPDRLLFIFTMKGLEQVKEIVKLLLFFFFEGGCVEGVVLEIFKI